MKLFDLALNATIILTATVFLAYIGLYYFDYGLFTILPDAVTEFFLAFGAIQYVALVLLVAALVAKVPTGRAIKRQDSGSRT